MSIRVINLEKRYDGSAAPALAGLSMHVPRGKVASVLGKSGAGKTTLLRCLSGLEPFDQGSIEVDGVTVNAGGRSPFAGRIGLVFQSFELFPHLSVLDNCSLAPIKVKGIGRAAAAAKAMELLSQLGLADKASAYPEALSGGQKQRVAIAQQLVVPRQLLLMDEPFSGLDPAALEDVMKLLVDVANLHELNTILVVTHDIRAAMAVSDTVYMLGRDRKDGKVIPGASIQATYDLVALDLAWKADVQTLPAFVTLEREIKAKFRTL
jgi:ABC-type polar amino acid transport system ATPase subunit